MIHFDKAIAPTTKLSLKFPPTLLFSTPEVKKGDTTRGFADLDQVVGISRAIKQLSPEELGRGRNAIDADASTVDPFIAFAIIEQPTKFTPNGYPTDLFQVQLQASFAVN
jgi:hypothetical protein